MIPRNRNERRGSESELDGEQTELEFGDSSSIGEWRKLEIPLFEGGDDAYGWVQKLERIFQIRGATEEAEKMHAVIVALDGAALSWYQLWESCNPRPAWQNFKSAVVERFQPTSAQDPFSALLRLKQGNTVVEFVVDYEKHAASITGLGEDYLMSIFLNGLKEEVETELRLYEQQSLSVMMKKARLIEEKSRAIGNGGGNSFNKGSYVNKSFTNNRSNTLILHFQTQALILVFSIPVLLSKTVI